jgi:hypothetical protein
MRTQITLLLLLAALLLLTACAGKGVRHCVDADPNDDVPPTCITVTGDAHADAFYAAQREAAQARRELQEQREARITSLAQACKTDDCVREVSRDATMSDALMVAGGVASDQPVRQFVRQPGGLERFALAAVGQTGALVQGAVAWRSSDNSVRTAEAQFGFLGGVVRDVSSASARSNEAAFSMIPELQPNITAGQNIAFGDMQIAGRDLLGDGARVGDDTAISIGEINTGTQIENAGNYGDNNRQTSPDDNSQTTTCEGPGCQGDNRPITNPLPEPEPEDEG